MGEFPSGQRGQTVNLLAMPSMVRIHLPPPKIPIVLSGRSVFFFVGKMESKFIPVRGNPSSPTKNTDCPSGRSVFFFARRRYRLALRGSFSISSAVCTSPPASPQTRSPTPLPSAQRTGFSSACTHGCTSALSRCASSRRDRPPTSASKQSAHTVSPPRAHGHKYASAHSGSGARHTSHRRIHVTPFRSKNYYAFE